MAYYNLMIIAGSLFLVIGLYFLRDRLFFIKNGIETYATVIRIEVLQTQTEEQHTSYIPHFRVITHDEKEIIFQYGRSGTWGKWSIGDQIKVVYNEAYPYDIVIRTFWGMYSKTIILFSAAFVLIIAGSYHYSIT